MGVTMEYVRSSMTLPTRSALQSEKMSFAPYPMGTLA